MKDIFAKAGPLVICILGCIIAIYVLVNPRKLRDSWLRSLNRRKDFLADAQKDIVQAKWFIINLKICAIILLVLSLMSLWFFIQAFKS
jgi:hypothetical protein